METYTVVKKPMKIEKAKGKTKNYQESVVKTTCYTATVKKILVKKNFLEIPTKVIMDFCGEFKKNVVIIRQKRCRTICQAHKLGDCCKGKDCLNFHQLSKETWVPVWERSEEVKKILVKKNFVEIPVNIIMEFCFPPVPRSGKNVIYM